MFLPEIFEEMKVILRSNNKSSFNSISKKINMLFIQNDVGT